MIDLYQIKKGEYFFSTMGLIYSLTGNSENVELIKQQQAQTEFDMTKAHHNNQPVKDNFNLHCQVADYMCKGYLINLKLGLNQPLTENEVNYVKDLREALALVKPLSVPINLFHGFNGNKFNNKDWKVGQSITFNQMLSKTPSFEVATIFSRFRCSYGKRSVVSKYLFCKYPTGTKHLSIVHRNMNNINEYEYLSGFETFILEDIVYELSLIPFCFRQYYILSL